MIDKDDIYRNPDEIQQAILTEVAKGNLRISLLSMHCCNEGTMQKVIQELKSQRLIDHDDTFIWRI